MMAKFLIVEARFYDHLNDMLVAGAKAALKAKGHEVEVITVPGALEIPGTIAMAAEAQQYDGFVAIGELNASGKKAFAAKALAAGFPQEYIEAMINESPAPTQNLTEIKEVMASNINLKVKKTVVAKMMKVANLDAANINRCKDYWKNELGYGDPEWVDALFENKN
jgi:hypothetical protein